MERLFFYKNLNRKILEPLNASWKALQTLLVCLSDSKHYGSKYYIFRT